jgi:hypothetical protein
MKKFLTHFSLKFSYQLTDFGLVYANGALHYAFHEENTYIFNTKFTSQSNI